MRSSACCFVIEFEVATISLRENHKPMASFFRTSLESYRGDSKHYNMMEFIISANNYIKTKSDDSEKLMHRHLQILSALTDYSIFDTNTSAVCEFFVTLHSLLNNLETRSNLLWCSINVLSAACRNPSTRHELIHTYQFLPPLSRFLAGHLSDEKKVTLLTIMEELSCGVKISWQIPNLSHLMTTLIQWIEKKEQNEQITTLCLGVLVHLCYKNPTAVYTLSKCRDIKQLIRLCTSLNVKTGTKLDTSIYKLLLILDFVDGLMPNNVFLKLINVTCRLIREAFEANDAAHLRYIVEFYLDVKNQLERNSVDIHNIFVYSFVNYAAEVNKILDTIESKSDGNMQPDAECMSSIFKFLHSLVGLKLPNLIPTNLPLITLSLHWLKTDYTGTEALSVLTAIYTNSKQSERNVFEQLFEAHSIFLEYFQNIDEDTVMTIDQCKKMCYMMRLLRGLVLNDVTRERTVRVLDEKIVGRVFLPLLGNKTDDAKLYSVEAILLYVNTLVLFNELRRFNDVWLDPLNTLLQHKQIHFVLAEGLYSGNQEMSSLILCMAAISNFPRNELALAMHQLQPSIKPLPKKSNKCNANINNFIGYPMISSNPLYQEAEVQKKEGDVSTSDLMSIYEHKLSSIRQTTEIAKTNEEIALEYRANLEHLTSGLAEEITRIKQSLQHSQKQYEDAQKCNASLKQYNRDLKNGVEAIKGRSKVAVTLLRQKENDVARKEEQEADLRKALKEKEDENANLEERNAKMKEAIFKMEESLKIEEKKNDNKDAEIKNVNTNVEHLKFQCMQVEKQLDQTKMELKSTKDELKRANDDLHEKSELVDTITKLTRRK